jgi:hypothetical protein
VVLGLVIVLALVVMMFATILILAPRVGRPPEDEGGVP